LDPIYISLAAGLNSRHQVGKGQGKMTNNSLPKRVLITLFVLIVCLVGRAIPLPTVTAEVSSTIGPRSAGSIMALGLSPLIAGYVLVEFAALVVPAWRPLRTGGTASRAKLHRASLIAGVILTAVQGLFLVVAFEQLAGHRGGHAFRFLTVMTLVGASAILVVLARVVDQEGLGSGFSVVLLAELAGRNFVTLNNADHAVQAGVLPSSAFVTGAFLMVMLVAATLWLFSSSRLPMDESSPHPSLIGRPGCGIMPLWFAAAVLVFPARLPQAGVPFGPQSAGYAPSLLLLGISAALVYTYLFNQPGRIAKAWRSLSPSPPEGIPRLKPVLVESVLFIALAGFVDLWGLRLGRSYFPSATDIILATALLCDLAREWKTRDADETLTPVWEIHQVYAVAPAVRLLESAGIPAFGRGLRVRSLLQFFGPHVPIELLVPAEHAARARAFLEERWPKASEAGAQAASGATVAAQTRSE
jgi:hypothetical protein